MKKLTIAVIALLSLSACDKMPWAHTPKSAFVKMCKEDPQAKAQGFDCDCQADILSAVLKQDEMTRLIDFIGIEKDNKEKAIEMGKDPSYEPIFRKIAGVGYAIHDKCGKPGAEPAAAQAPAQSSAVPPQTLSTQTPAKAPSNFQPATVVGRPAKK